MERECRGCGHRTNRKVCPVCRTDSNPAGLVETSCPKCGTFWRYRNGERAFCPGCGFFRHSGGRA